MTTTEAKRLLRSLRRKRYQKFFTVEFVKRTTGEVRRMNCRLGVTKHLKGGPQAYDPKKHGLLVVFEPEKGYRSINLEQLRGITLEGKRYKIEEGVKWLIYT